MGRSVRRNNQAPVVCLDPGGAEPLVPNLCCPLIQCDRFRRLPVTLCWTTKLHGSILSLVEFGVGRTTGTVAFLDGLGGGVELRAAVLFGA